MRHSGASVSVLHSKPLLSIALIVFATSRIAIFPESLRFRRRASLASLRLRRQEHLDANECRLNSTLHEEGSKKIIKLEIIYYSKFMHSSLMI